MYYGKDENGLRPVLRKKIPAQYTVGDWKGKLQWWGFLIRNHLGKIKEGFMRMIS